MPMSADPEFPIATPIPDQACPDCGATLRRGRAARAIQAGDVAVCAECACMLAVGEGLRIERMTTERLATLPAATRNELLGIARRAGALIHGPRPLTFWVVYFGATNHPPGKWVVRAQDASERGVRPHEVFFECNSLAEARAKVPAGLVLMPRYAGDDPCIVETWV